MVMRDISARLAALSNDGDRLEYQYLPQDTKAANPWECTQAAYARTATALVNCRTGVQDIPFRPRLPAYNRLYRRRQNRKAGIKGVRCAPPARLLFNTGGKVG